MAEAFGEGPNQKIWSQLIHAAGDQLGHRLWAVVIREIATATAENEDRLGVVQSNSQDALEDRIQEIISELLYDALPAGSDLAWILGELDFFRDDGWSWEEKFSFVGDANHHSLPDLIGDLHRLVEPYPDAVEAITEECVETFYEEWRSRFFRAVLSQVKALSSRGDSPNITGKFDDSKSD